MAPRKKTQHLPDWYFASEQDMPGITAWRQTVEAEAMAQAGRMQFDAAKKLLPKIVEAHIASAPSRKADQ